MFNNSSFNEVNIYKNFVELKITLNIIFLTCFQYYNFTTVVKNTVQNACKIKFRCVRLIFLQQCNCCQVEVSATD